jgi:hypothetical protein
VETINTGYGLPLCLCFVFYIFLPEFRLQNNKRYEAVARIIVCIRRRPAYFSRGGPELEFKQSGFHWEDLT